MKKYIIPAAVFAACLALCAAVWPQNEAVEETPAPLRASVVSAPEPTVEDIASEIEITPPAEEEKFEIPQVEPLYENIPETEPVPEEELAIPEVQPIPESEPEPAQTPSLEPIPTPVSPQTVTDPQPGDMVYVPGFGWLECQEPGEVIYDESIYENGNKIGIMG